MVALKEKSSDKKEIVKKTSVRDFPTLNLSKEYDIAYDFANKVYTKFEKMIKSIVLFGSTAKRIAESGSDIDIIVIVDDCSVQWDEELVAWYREELGKIVQANPYKKSLHINTVRLSTWWQDLIRGDPVVVNVIRYGEPLIDFGGFFIPLKTLLQQGRIRSTPEAIYTALQRAPLHMLRSKAAVLNSIEGLYWAMVDSAHAALIAAKQTPPSPEHIGEMLTEQFVKQKMLNPRLVLWYNEMYNLAHKILHGTVKEIKGNDIDLWHVRTDEFVRTMAGLIKKIV